MSSSVRVIQIETSTGTIVFRGAMLLIGLGVLGCLIALLVCVCPYIHKLPGLIKDLHETVQLASQLVPCLADEFCAPPVLV